MFCTQCGNQNPEGANNCVACGAAINSADFIQNEPIPSYEEESQILDQAPVSDNQETEPVILESPETPKVPATLPGKGLGIASLVLGIISLLLSCCCMLISLLLSFLSCCCMPIPLPIAGLVMGIISNKKAKEVGMKNGIATAGIILCAVALVAAIVSMVLGFLGGFANGFMSAFNEPTTYYEPYTYYFI